MTIHTKDNDISPLWVTGDLQLAGILDSRIIELLKAIGQSGSLNQAAKQVIIASSLRAFPNASQPARLPRQSPRPQRAARPRARAMQSLSLLAGLKRPACRRPCPLPA